MCRPTWNHPYEENTPVQLFLVQPRTLNHIRMIPDGDHPILFCQSFYKRISFMTKVSQKVTFDLLSVDVYFKNYPHVLLSWNLTNIFLFDIWNWWFMFIVPIVIVIVVLRKKYKRVNTDVSPSIFLFKLLESSGRFEIVRQWYLIWYIFDSFANWGNFYSLSSHVGTRPYWESGGSKLITWRLIMEPRSDIVTSYLSSIHLRRQLWSNTGCFIWNNSYSKNSVWVSCFNFLFVPYRITCLQLSTGSRVEEEGGRWHKMKRGVYITFTENGK